VHLDSEDFARAIAGQAPIFPQTPYAAEKLPLRAGTHNDKISRVSTGMGPRQAALRAVSGALGKCLLTISMKKCAICPAAPQRAVRPDSPQGADSESQNQAS